MSKRLQGFGSFRWLWFAAAMTVAPVGPARAAVGDNSVGMNIHVGYPFHIEAAAAMGVGWVRVDGNWLGFEPTRGSHVWWLDDTVTRAHAAGLKVFMSLGYTPNWARRHPGTAGHEGNCPPANVADWTNMVKAVVTHYRAMGVTHFGMWNEANLGGFWEGTIDEYTSLIAVPGSAAVRSVCSDCKVLGPELANMHDDADDVLESVLRNAPGAFDIISHHSYNGFEELGTTFFGGDRFPEVLDHQRCVPPLWCGRRSLRQVLDAVGWMGEVWITETGWNQDNGGTCNPAHAATPSDATGDIGEQKQGKAVSLVLNEQLLRPWYTNTFFYEMSDCGYDQAGCLNEQGQPTDGFGFLWPTRGTRENRHFNLDNSLTDACAKDAFWALKDFIAAHPEITGGAHRSQCNDGSDNDADGRIDLADRGCSGASDDNEADDPPRKQLVAYRTNGIVVDGALADWGTPGWTVEADAPWFGSAALSGPADLVVLAAARWDAQALYLAFDVTDDIHDNSHVPSELWMGDNVQLAFDISQNGGLSYDSVDDHEINVALAGGTTRVWRDHGPAGAGSGWTARVVRGTTGRTFYEVALPVSVLPGMNLAAGQRVGFSFIMNEADNNGRDGWREFTKGIGMGKQPEWYATLTFNAQVAAPGGLDAGPATDAAQPDAGVVPGDAGEPVRPDSGVTPPDAGRADAGVANAVDAGGVPPTTTRCSCNVSGDGAPALAAWLLATFVLVRRRR